MTVGERIQYYRKRIGISQEELGQRLLVSRQTISLWEMDKTLPTIDNLLRLREIFGVSVDLLLSGEEPLGREPTVPEPEPAPEPREKYSFTYSREEVGGLVAASYSNAIRGPIFAIAAFFVCLFATSLSDGSGRGLYWLFGGMLILSCIALIRILRMRMNLRRRLEERMPECVYSYEVYDGRIDISISKSGEIRKFFRFDFADVAASAVEAGDYLMLVNAGQSFFLRRAELAPDSVFYSFVKQRKKLLTLKRSADKRRSRSILFTVCSVASIWMALIAAAILSGITGHTLEEHAWTFLVFMAVPMASIVYGVRLRLLGYKKCLHNIIVGVIIMLFLLLFGVGNLNSAQNISHDSSVVLRAEQIIGVDVPDGYSHINTRTYEEGSTSGDGLYRTIRISHIYYLHLVWSLSGSVTCVA